MLFFIPLLEYSPILLFKNYSPFTLLYKFFIAFIKYILFIVFKSIKAKPIIISINKEINNIRFFINITINFNFIFIAKSSTIYSIIYFKNFIKYSKNVFSTINSTNTIV